MKDWQRLRSRGPSSLCFTLYSTFKALTSGCAFVEALFRRRQTEKLPMIFHFHSRSFFVLHSAAQKRGEKLISLMAIKKGFEM